MRLSPGMDKHPYIPRRPVLITGETHQALKSESAKMMRPIKDVAEEAVLIGLSMMAQKGDLYKLAKKAASLNPDAGEIGPGMLAQLVDLGNRALGKELVR